MADPPPVAAHDSEGWQLVDGVGEPADTLFMTDVDLVPELTHSIRGMLMRRLRTPRTVAELADELDAPITRLYHHINKLEDKELIRVVATRRVGAVTERRYQVTALSWRFAEEAFEKLDPREMSQALGSLFDVAKIGLQREIESGLMDDLPVEHERFALSLGELTLRPEHRLDLFNRIEKLFREFGDISSAHTDDPEAERTTLFISAYPEH